MEEKTIPPGMHTAFRQIDSGGGVYFSSPWVFQDKKCHFKLNQENGINARIVPKSSKLENGLNLT